jgi:hypothetical protein
VVTSDPKTKEITIATVLGEVVVKSETPLPPGAEVLVRLYLDKARLMANIAVIKQQSAMAQEVIQTIKTPPMLVKGATVTALLLPEPQGPETLANTVFRIVDFLKAATSPAPPGTVNMIPVGTANIIPVGTANIIPVGTANIIKDLLQMPDIKASFIKLPAARQAEILSFIEQPETILTGKPALLIHAQNPPVSGAALPLIPADISLPGTQHRQTLRILGVFQPGTTPEQVATALNLNPAAKTSLQIATVESITAGGIPVLKTEHRHMTLTMPAAVQTGSIVAFEPVAAVPEKAPLPQGLPPVFDPLASLSWPALEETLQVVAHAAPEAAAMLRDTLPSPTPRLPAAALFFLAALRMGSVENWLGEKNLSLLRAAGKKELIEKLGGDFSKMSAQSRESLPGEWKAISMPLLHDEHLSQMQFFVRHQHDQEKGDEKDGKTPVTRFILNLKLSRMGDMQLDGLVRQKKFDLILRTDEKMSLTMRQELMQAFAKGLGQVKMQGGISFQTRTQGWVQVIPPAAAGTVA